MPLGAALALQVTEEPLHGGKVQEDRRVARCGLLGGLGLLGMGHAGGRVTPEEGQLVERILLVAHGEPYGIEPPVDPRRIAVLQSARSQYEVAHRLEGR